MLIGEYKHSLDPKKRLSIPIKLRTELGKEAIITRGLDKCLFVFPRNEWQSLAEKMSKMPLGWGDTRSFARLMISGAMEVDFDSLGRILIPDYLKNYAGLTKVVIIAGVFNRLEIWDESKWIRYRKGLEKNSEKIAEKLGELGII